MDSELREAFATLSSQLAAVGTDAREASSRSRETAMAVSKLAGKVDRLESEVERVKDAVFGSNPPPPPAAPLAKRVTEGEGDIADLTGRLMALSAEVALVKEQNAEQLVKLDLITKAVTSVVANPMVRRLAYALAALLLAWLTAAQAKVLP